MGFNLGSILDPSGMFGGGSSGSAPQVAAPPQVPTPSKPSSYQGQMGGGYSYNPQTGSYQGYGNAPNATDYYNKSYIQSMLYGGSPQTYLNNDYNQQQTQYNNYTGSNYNPYAGTSAQSQSGTGLGGYASGKSNQNPGPVPPKPGPYLPTTGNQTIAPSQDSNKTPQGKPPDGWTNPYSGAPWHGRPSGGSTPNYDPISSIPATSSSSYLQSDPYSQSLQNNMNAINSVDTSSMGGGLIGQYQQSMNGTAGSTPLNYQWDPNQAYSQLQSNQPNTVGVQQQWGNQANTQLGQMDTAANSNPNLMAAQEAYSRSYGLAGTQMNRTQLPTTPGLDPNAATAWQKAANIQASQGAQQAMNQSQQAMAARGMGGSSMDELTKGQIGLQQGSQQAQNASQAIQMGNTIKQQLYQDQAQNAQMGIGQESDIAGVAQRAG